MGASTVTGIRSIDPLGTWRYDSVIPNARDALGTKMNPVTASDFGHLSRYIDQVSGRGVGHTLKTGKQQLVGKLRAAAEQKIEGKPLWGGIAKPDYRRTISVRLSDAISVEGIVSSLSGRMNGRMDLVEWNKVNPSDMPLGILGRAAEDGSLQVLSFNESRTVDGKTVDGIRDIYVTSQALGMLEKRLSRLVLVGKREAGPAVVVEDRLPTAVSVLVKQMIKQANTDHRAAARIERTKAYIMNLPDFQAPPQNTESGMLRAARESAHF